MKPGSVFTSSRVTALAVVCITDDLEVDLAARDRGIPERGVRASAAIVLHARRVSSGAERRGAGVPAYCSGRGRKRALVAVRVERVVRRGDLRRRERSGRRGRGLERRARPQVTSRPRAKCSTSAASEELPTLPASMARATSSSPRPLVEARDADRRAARRRLHHQPRAHLAERAPPRLSRAPSRLREHARGPLGDREPRGGERDARLALVHRQRAGEHPRSDVRHVEHLEEALERAVLPHRAVHRRENDVIPPRPDRLGEERPSRSSSRYGVVPGLRERRRDPRRGRAAHLGLRRRSPLHDRDRRDAPSLSPSSILPTIGLGLPRIPGERSAQVRSSATCRPARSRGAAPRRRSSGRGRTSPKTTRAIPAVRDQPKATPARGGGHVDRRAVDPDAVAAGRLDDGVRLGVHRAPGTQSAPSSIEVPLLVAVREPANGAVVAGREDRFVADDDRSDELPITGRTGRDLARDVHEVLVPRRRGRGCWDRMPRSVEACRLGGSWGGRIDVAP